MKTIFCVCISVMCALCGFTQSSFNNNTAKNNNGLSIETLLKQSMFVKLYLSKTKVYIGEPLMAVYSFYTAVSGMPRVTHQPVFEGFGVKELNYSNSSADEVINGETYSVYTVRKVQLTPVREGSIELGSAFVNNDIELPSPGDPYSTNHYDIAVSSSPASVEVIPLPEENVPDNFKGALGKFAISIKTSPNTLHANETGHLYVTVKGRGNFEAVTEPVIAWPKKIEHYEGSDSQHVDTKNFPESGDVTFDIPFIAKDSGNFTLPPVRFSYFNTDNAKYETASTDSLAMQVLPAIAQQPLPEQSEDITNKKYLWIVAGIAIVVLLVSVIGYRRNAAKAAELKKKNIAPAAPVVPVIETPVVTHTNFDAKLNDLQTITDKKEFFCSAKDLLSKAISEKLQASQHAEVFLLEVLKQQHPDMYLKANAFYENTNFHIYAPFEQPAADNTVYIEQLRELISDIQAI